TNALLDDVNVLRSHCDDQRESEDYACKNDRHDPIVLPILFTCPLMTLTPPERSARAGSIPPDPGYGARVPAPGRRVGGRQCTGSPGHRVGGGSGAARQPRGSASTSDTSVASAAPVPPAAVAPRSP